MRRGIKLLAGSVVGVGLLYASGPVIAGFFEIGDREGPRIYSEAFHTSIYDFACEARTGQKPESGSLRNVLFNRPVFYGQPREPKPIGERYAIQANAEMRELPIRKELRQWNEEIDNAGSP